MIYYANKTDKTNRQIESSSKVNMIQIFKDSEIQIFKYSEIQRL